MNLQNHPGVLRILILAVLRGFCLVYFAIGEFQAEGDVLRKAFVSAFIPVEPLSESPGHIAMDKPWNFRYISPGTSGDATRRYFPYLANGIQLLMPGLPYTNGVDGWKRDLCNEFLKVAF
jgi:hypothetical protein